VAARRALAESRNAATVRLAQEVGIEEVLRTARDLGIRTPLQPYITTALGASEVQLLEVANAYRAMASGLRAEPHVIQRVTAENARVLWEASAATRPVAIEPAALAAIQEGLRGVVRFGTAYELQARQPEIAVMGKTGTSSDYRDALFVGSTYGPTGVTIAVRIGFDDNRELGSGETGGRVALPVFRRIVAEAYTDEVLGAPPPFPQAMEDGINRYLSGANIAEAVEETEGEVDSLPSLVVTQRPLLVPVAAPARVPNE
jgi:penicillin-binding protein 1A